MTVLLYFSSNPTEGCLKNKQGVLVFLLRSNTVISLLLWMKKAWREKRGYRLNAITSLSN
ncbi:hypothetical protein PEC301889_30990 [Pectobacterium carotovorum subsp. carotovorum]|nr:hypothetical protein PEC301889_30990 [Pectobacterium carotovorum subsp. carotovorum]